MTPAVYNYNNKVSKSQVEINQILPPISLPETRSTHLLTNLHSHASDRCDVFADTIVKKKSIQNLIAECGKRYVVFKCVNCNKRYAVKLRCHQRLCPHCAWVRAMKWYHKLRRVRFQYPMFLTLTLLPDDDLKKLISQAIIGFQRFKRHFRIEKGVYSVEICKRENQDKKGSWYVHIHCLIDKVWLNGEEVSKYWRELTGAYVKKIKRVSNTPKGILEVCKYVTKGLNGLSKEDLEEVNEAIKSRRLINTLGILKSEYSLLDTLEISLPKRCECEGRLWYEKTISEVEFRILKAFTDIVEIYDTS